MTSESLAGLRILLVEDEMLISLLIEEVLIEQQCTIVGPYADVPSALAAVQDETFDLAILDVNIAGQKIYPVAEIISSRAVPFVLLSGYGQAGVPKDRPEWRVCAKPFRNEQLIALLIEQIKNK